MAMFAPTRKARPTVWRIRTNGNAQSDGSSRIQIPSGHASIQRKNESMRAECYRTHSTAETDRPRKDDRVTNVGLWLWDLGFQEEGTGGATQTPPIPKLRFHLNLSEPGVGGYCPKSMTRTRTNRAKSLVFFLVLSGQTALYPRP